MSSLLSARIFVILGGAFEILKLCSAPRAQP
jgi:hypothetical protein